MSFELSLFTARGNWSVLTTNPENGELETVGLSGTGRLVPRFSPDQALSLVDDDAVPEALLFDSIPFQLIDGEMRKTRKLPSDPLPEYVEAPTSAGLPLADGFRYEIEFDELTAFGRTHRIRAYLFEAPSTGGEKYIPGFAPAINSPARGVVSPIDDIDLIAGSLTFYFQGEQVGNPIPLPAVGPHTHTVADLTDATTVGKALIKAVDAAAARGAISAITAAEAQAMVNTSVNSLVSGAPGALDNFMELATALGNNPNFATDIIAMVNARYTKPAGGIPKTDLAAAVQTSLGKADTALQNLPDITELVQDIVADMAVAGANVTITYNDATGKLTWASTGGGGGGGLDAEGVRDTIAAAIQGSGYIVVTSDDALDTITVSGSAALQTALDARQAKFMTGTVATAAATAAKTVTLDAPRDTYTPVNGDILLITYTNGNSAGGITLSVNAGTARNIRIGGNNVGGASHVMAAGGRALYQYDSATTSWQMLGGATSNFDFSNSATAFQVALRDGAAYLVARGYVGSVDAVTAAATTTAIVYATAPIHIVTGTTTHAFTLPTTSVPAGFDQFFMNLSTGSVAITSSNGEAVAVLTSGQTLWLKSTVATPTTAAQWKAMGGTFLTDSKQPKATGTPDGTKFLRDDNTWAPVPGSSGGNDARVGVAATYLGNGSVGPFTWNHGQNSRDILGLSVRDVITGQNIIVDNYTAGPNSLRFEPSVVWANDRIRVSASFALLTGDTQSPTAPTVVEGAKTTSTIAVTATGSTDNVGVVLYRWWLNGILVAETTSNAYTFTGLNGAQEYNCGCTTLDKAYNESALGFKLITTPVPANVAFESAGAGGRDVTANGTAQWSHTVPSGLSNAIMLVPVVVSHSGWYDLAAGNYSGSGISSSLDGAGFSRAGTGFAAAAIGFGTQIEGGVEIWYKQNPTPGAHTISAQRIPGASQSTSIIGNSFLYSGVGVIEAYETAEWASGGDTVTALLAAASSTNDMLFFAAGGNNPFAGFNRTLRSTPAGGAVTGMGDYALFGDAVGAAGTVQFQDTATKIWAAAKVRLRKAGT